MANTDNTEELQNSEIPVFLINGFLEGGKTSFINYTISEEYFHIDENTLLIVTEEGEVEYNRDVLKREHTRLIVIEDQEELTKEKLKELADECKAERIVIEWNGMWNPDTLRFPDNWQLYQQITIFNGLTLDSYLANMKSLMGPMLRYTELLLINRCDGIPEEKLLGWKRQLRPMLMQGAEIIMESSDGEVPLEVIPEDLPYDVSQDPLKIRDEDYGVWFFDCRDYTERYLGKTVIFTAEVMKDKSFASNIFVPGRKAMTCCEADMSFIGFMAEYSGIKAFNDGDWVIVTAVVEEKDCEAYGGTGPFLKVKELVRTGEISEAVTF